MLTTSFSRHTMKCHLRFALVILSDEIFHLFIMSSQITNTPSFPKDNDRGIRAVCPGVLGLFTDSLQRGVDDKNMLNRGIWSWICKYRSTKGKIHGQAAFAFPWPQTAPSCKARALQTAHSSPIWDWGEQWSAAHEWGVITWHFPCCGSRGPVTQAASKYDPKGFH